MRSRRIRGFCKSDDHRQAILHPRLSARRDGPVEPEFLGQFQKTKTRPVFLGTQEIHVLRRTFWHDVTAESSLEKFELRERQSDESAMCGVFDFSVLAERGADDAHGGSAMGLNFEVAGMRFQSDGHILTIITISVNEYIYICMAISETQKQRKYLKLAKLRFS